MKEKVAAMARMSREMEKWWMSPFQLFTFSAFNAIRQVLVLNQKGIFIKVGGTAFTATSVVVDLQNRDQPNDKPKAIHETVQAALEYIKKYPNSAGKIIASAIDVTHEHFRSNLVPQLTKLGVRNDKNGSGYYLPADV